MLRQSIEHYIFLFIILPAMACIPVLAGMAWFFEPGIVACGLVAWAIFAIGPVLLFFSMLSPRLLRRIPRLHLNSQRVFLLAGAARVPAGPLWIASAIATIVVILLPKRYTWPACLFLIRWTLKRLNATTFHGTLPLQRVETQSDFEPDLNEFVASAHERMAYQTLMARQDRLLWWRVLRWCLQPTLQSAFIDPTTQGYLLVGIYRDRPCLCFGISMSAILDMPHERLDFVEIEQSSILLYPRRGALVFL